MEFSFVEYLMRPIAKARSKQTVDFIIVADVAKQRGCDVRTIYALISRGILPPLVGYQKGLAAKDKGWDRTYWDEWHRQQAQDAIERSHTMPSLTKTVRNSG